MKNAVIFAGRQMGVEKCLFLLYCECMGNNRSTLEFREVYSFWAASLFCVIIDPHWNLEETLYLLLGWERGNNRSTLEFRGSLRIM